MTIFTSLLKNKEGSRSLGYLVHSTENPEIAGLVVTTSEYPGRQYKVKECFCSDCTNSDTIKMTRLGGQPFEVLKSYDFDNESELEKFALSYDGTTDPATLLNEPLFKAAFHHVQLKHLTGRQLWRARGIVEFDKARTEETESTKRRFAHEVLEKTAEVERLLVEIETAKARLANVEVEFEVKRQKLVDDAESAAAELAELQKNSS